MSEITSYEQGDVERVETDMSRWASDAQEIARMAASLVQTSFVPAAMRGKPAEATAAILTGLEVGLQPMAALRSIDVIQGTPALRAVTLRALVQGAGHEVWVDEQTKTRAVVKGRRRGSDVVQESVWTTDRAKDLGLLGKDNWKKQPGAMLVARATAECCRLVAADVILGLPYAVEELTDEGPVDEVEVKPRARRTAKRKPVEESVESPAEAEVPAQVEQVSWAEDETPWSKEAAGGS